MAADRADPDRPPLREAVLSQDLIRPGGLWEQIRVVQVTGSTNADLLAEAAAGAAGGRVLVAEAQTAGRGRLERQWVSPPRASLTFSVLLRPADLPQARRAWIPLLAGVAVASALRRSAAVDARLKWPNDVLVGGAKLAGILAEQHRDAVVVGVGINVTLSRQDLPVPGATSLLLENAAEMDREQVLGAVLREFEHWYMAWAGGTDPDASGLRAEYLHRCATIGRQVRVELPGGRALTGIAADVDAGGRLVVRTSSGLTSCTSAETAGRADRHIPCHDVPYGRWRPAFRGRAERADPAPTLEDAAAADSHSRRCGGRRSRGGDHHPGGPRRRARPYRCRRGRLRGGAARVRGALPALADDQLPAHHPQIPAPLRHPDQDRPGFPADQDQRRLVLARAHRPAARLWPAHRGVRGRARPTRPQRDPRGQEGAGHALPAGRGRGAAPGPR